MHGNNRSVVRKRGEEMKYTIEIKVILEEQENHTTEEIEERLKDLLEDVSVNSGFGKVTCEDGRVIEVKK